MMSKRLPSALTAAALCSLFGALHAQTTDAPDPTGQQRYQQPIGAPQAEPSSAPQTEPSSVPQSEPNRVPQNEPADVLPGTRPAMSPPLTEPVSPVPVSRDVTPSRGDVQAETRAAMRSRQIPHGELSTPEQDKGSQRALAPFERGITPSAY